MQGIKESPKRFFGGRPKALQLYCHNHWSCNFKSCLPNEDDDDDDVDDDDDDDAAADDAAAAADDDDDEETSWNTAVWKIPPQFSGYPLCEL